MEMLEVAVPIPDTAEGTEDDSAPFYASWPRNKWEIPEPPHQEDGSTATTILMKPAQRGDVDLLVAPGLAFDRDGRRLGQGKGYYDRFLQRMTKEAEATTTKTTTNTNTNTTMVIVAVGLQCQLVEQVPTQPNDHPMDIVVVPNEVIHVERERKR
jgi:5-formyltetrahydrofolate cyclo-ligase